VSTLTLLGMELYVDALPLPAFFLRVTNKVMQGFAQVCRICLSKQFSCLCLVPCCTVLRSRWCLKVASESPRIIARGSSYIGNWAY
jgi:hypothetical protein